MKKKIYIKTFGCQMNENDSAQILALLAKDHYEPTAHPQEADLILVNTCSVREKSYHKAISAIGTYQNRQDFKPSVQIGVAGCVASQEGEKIAKRFPFVDFVLGTDQIHRIAEAVRYTQLHDGAFIATDFQEVADYHFPEMDVVRDGSCHLRHPFGVRLKGRSKRMARATRRADSPSRMVKAYITIMKGCDNACSFCIVPFTRGAEVSRPPTDIIREIQDLEKRGVIEVTLLGQNVNSYGKGLPKKIDFPQLLQMIERDTGIKRLRFTSPHPKDLSPKLIEEYSRNKVLCRHIHLPAQSGSSRILKKMRRAHTRETYLRRTRSLRAICPDIAITTDIIVGFPGETEEDFQKTLSLIREVRYDASYSFAYSERPGTEAAMFPDDVSKEEKSRRLQEVQNLQKEISLEINRKLIGKTVSVLVEGISKAGKEQLTGRTSSNKIANFIARPSDIGAILDTRVTRISPYALYGEVTA